MTRVSLVRPKLTQSVHYCQETNIRSLRDYNDPFNLGELLTIGLPNAYPTKDMEGNKLSAEFGLHTFKDY